MEERSPMPPQQLQSWSRPQPQPQLQSSPRRPQHQVQAESQQSSQQQQQRSPSPRVKPLLRGVLHQVAAWLAAPAALALWLEAHSEPARVGALVYGLSLLGLFAVSAIYHVPTWAPKARDWMGRLDHSAIFVLIAGTYTPFGLLLGPSGGYTVLTVVWGGALMGIVLSLLWPRAPKPLMAAIFVALGWVFVMIGPQLFFALGPANVTLLLVGGLFYTAGAVVYAVKRPDPLPRVFGYHEVFHLFVVIAAVLHYVAVATILPFIA